MQLQHTSSLLPFFLLDVYVVRYAWSWTAHAPHSHRSCIKHSLDPLASGSLVGATMELASDRNSKRQIPILATNTSEDTMFIQTQNITRYLAIDRANKSTRNTPASVQSRPTTIPIPLLGDEGGNRGTATNDVGDDHRRGVG